MFARKLTLVKALAKIVYASDSAFHSSKTEKDLNYVRNHLASKAHSRVTRLLQLTRRAVQQETDAQSNKKPRHIAARRVADRILHFRFVARFLVDPRR